MPTYRVETDKGTYRVDLDKPPASPDQLKSMVEDALGTPKATLIQRGLKALTSGLSAGLNVTSGTPLPIRVMQSQGFLQPKALGGMPSPTTPTTDALAQAIVPQNETQLGMMGATLATAPFTGGMSIPAAMATRVAAGALGGAGGAALSGESPLKGAAEGGLGALGGETLGAVGSKLYRALPNVPALGIGRAAINRKDVSNFIDVVERVVPSLRGQMPRRAEELNRFANIKTGMKQVLGDAYDAVINSVSRQVQRGMAPTTGTLNVPALSPTPLTLKQASDLLTEIGTRGFSGTAGNPATTTAVSAPTRHLWAQARDQIRSEILRQAGPDAVTEWEAGRKSFAIGNAVRQLLRPESFKGGPNAVEVNMNRLRSGFEKRLGKFANDMLPDDFQALVQTLYRGAQIGSRDRMAPGMGNIGESFGELMTGKGGAPQIIFSPIRALLPNWSSYTGRPPLSIPNAGQAAIDAETQRALDALRSGQ